ncbi:E3 ubiquitin-protein ligase RNF4 [Ricinus communis]|uniref:RING finger protein, putative n=1 Tax=Ricinus communis TaxID=3988 RepID=B9T3C7_RICCO|nr:E3 ubiquitin-protein ligase RNF4 [Ricinus communis]XP_015583077.1 E3 ubiquitin-protein ligase RNF4 [Ricinus communis]XP_015583078.1 E3 ubiquitin-protein ligase RNF4 [Ricinus communis]EEF29648.1 RING finger protein, putative [Ricinus communis]|eukprot:XP_002532746.1 E3 ubiquitin-protein ligase RNF4 [Ricinus communis]
MSTQTQGVRGPPLRGYRRRKTMLDLNVPPSESRDQEGTSSQDAHRGGQTTQQGQQSVPLTTIDVEALEDDVVESSPRAFAEAKNNAQRNNLQRNHAQRTRGSTVIVDVDSGRTTRLTYAQNKRRRVSSNQTIINCDHYVNLESSSSSMRDNIQPRPPPPPKEPTFNCPICMGPFIEETSTKCGHIFCKACIKTAIGVQSKCPTCRKRVTIKELIRVFLPATSAL